MADEDTTQDRNEGEPEEEVVEFEFNDDGEADLKKTLKKLRADLKIAQNEKQEYLTGWQKERAEFTNYRMGESERYNRMKENAREDILERFLTVMDSFNMAFANKEAWEKVDPAWRKGVEYIYSQLEGVFSEYGVVPIGQIGERFDPTMHESIETASTDKETEDHTVAEVIQRGYRLGEKVIRPARVHVYEYRSTK